MELIISFFLDKKKELVNNTKSSAITPRTYSNIEVMANHFISFLYNRSTPNLLPKNIDNRVISQYETYLHHTKGFNNNYTISCLQLLKSVLEYTIRINEISSNPMNGFHFLKKR